MPERISEAIDINLGNIAADISTADLTSPYYSVKNARKITAKVFGLALADGEVVEIQLKQATDSSGTGAKVLGSKVTVANGTGGAANVEAVVEAEVTDMDINGGFDHVAATIGSDGTSIVGGSVILLGDKRYQS